MRFSILNISHQKFLAVLAVIFAVEFALLAIAPHHRDDWLLENVLVFLIAIVLGLTWKRFPLSRISYFLIFLFLAVHEIGSHYTYAEVPYDSWLRSLTGFSLNQYMGWERNHFDRFVHLIYGLLLAYPIREVYCRIADVKGFWAYFFPLELTMATSMMYEMIEWGAAAVFGGELGMAYLGTQGDVWDAHKDMLFATLGAFVAMLLTLLLNAFIQRDYFRKLADSFRVKHKLPLGEDEIRRLLKQRK
jgi:putative membrane protein